MGVSRREFLGTTAAAGIAGLVRLEPQTLNQARKVFRHGVASGDPLAEGVILWTRVSAPSNATPRSSGRRRRAARSPEVVWRLQRTAYKRSPRYFNLSESIPMLMA
jgi:phosphodiesterase/alkaline phosphatase D-like protein